MKHLFLAIAATLAGSIPSGAIAQSKTRKPSRPPNILFVMVDDLGPEWIACCGGEGIATPRIDELARTGMRFTNAYSMPKCTPTRVTLLTGQYPFRHGWVNHFDVPRWAYGCHFDPKHNMTFARILRKAGYKTAIAGKWQLNDFRVQPNVLRDHGFDDWCMWTGGEGANLKSNKRYWDPYIHTKDGSKTWKGKFGPDVFTDFLCRFIAKHKDAPMLLYFPMALTHGPLVHTPHAMDAKGKLDKHKAMVRYTDHCVGRLLDTLTKHGLRDDTIVIFTTDNGSGRGIRGKMNGRAVRGGKGQPLETGCRVPFLVSCPGRVPQGVVRDTLTDFTDLLPTFARLAGVRVPEDVVTDGRSIADVILGRSPDGRRQWIMAMGGGVAARRDGRVVPKKVYADRVIRDKRFKLWVVDGKPAKLFDLQEDPAEENDVFGEADPIYTAARAKLGGVLRVFPKRDAAPRYDRLPKQEWEKPWK